jgi:threonine/homoserine/homoserine lactone efflux protein
MLAIANPKAFAAIGAVYTGATVLPGEIFFDAAVKIAALLAVMVTVNTAWLFFGSMLSKVLHDPRASRIANITFAVLLVASVALALL